uniref:Uncharacterized protein n=1 Tax=Arundo donax TaxID=35708 RepID=A0A0A9ER21_ARUDO
MIESKVTEYGVDAAFLDPGTPSRIKGRERTGSTSPFLKGRCTLAAQIDCGTRRR